MRLICRNTPIILNLPFDRLRRRGEADDVILEMGEATGLHVPIAAAIANAQRLGDPILQEGFELVAPALPSSGTALVKSPRLPPMRSQWVSQPYIAT